MEIKEMHNCSRENSRICHKCNGATSKIFWPFCGMVVSPLPSLLVQTRPHKLDDDRHHLLNFHFFFLVAKLTPKIATHNFFKNHKMIVLCL